MTSFLLKNFKCIYYLTISYIYIYYIFDYNLSSSSCFPSLPLHWTKPFFLPSPHYTFYLPHCGPLHITKVAGKSMVGVRVGGSSEGGVHLMKIRPLKWVLRTCAMVSLVLLPVLVAGWLQHGRKPFHWPFQLLVACCSVNPSHHAIH